MPVRSASQAAANYRSGVEAIGGAAKYYECGGRKGSGFLAVAACLNAAKQTAGLDKWITRYTQAAGGAA